jgi:hypothetical protein
VPGRAKPYQAYWGDEVEDLGKVGTTRRVRIPQGRKPPIEGFVAAATKFRDTRLLRLSMVDVQQGDGLILETPGGKLVFIDGGDNQLFARHVAARFPGTSETDPLMVDAVVVTHGDADHFEGLTELTKSEEDTRAHKRVFVCVRRVLHNGLVKRPKSAGETGMLGPTTVVDGQRYCTGLVEDVLATPASEMNTPFKTWRRTLEKWRTRLAACRPGEALEFRRVDQHQADAFSFLTEEGLEVDVLGPITEQVDGAPALAFLRSPPKDANLELGLDPEDGPSGSESASHTINGHSISFRLRYGAVRFLFTGDLNQESMARIRKAVPGAVLRAEIFKTPHHGSHEFDYPFLKAVAPVVSIISSGDESEQKEHIHPRATLLAALGRASRTTPSLIFCTELAAFFKMRGPARGASGGSFFAFERKNFGIIHIRTDGHRVLAFTHSGKAGMNEAYRFTVGALGAIRFAKSVTSRAAPKAA